MSFSRGQLKEARIQKSIFRPFFPSLFATGEEGGTGTGEKTATLLTVTRPLVRTVKTVIGGQMKGSKKAARYIRY